MKKGEGRRTESRTKHPNKRTNEEMRNEQAKLPQHQMSLSLDAIRCYANTPSPKSKSWLTTDCDQLLECSSMIRRSSNLIMRMRSS